MTEQNREDSKITAETNNKLETGDEVIQALQNNCIHKSNEPS